MLWTMHDQEQRLMEGWWARNARWEMRQRETADANLATAFTE